MGGSPTLPTAFTQLSYLTGRSRGIRRPASILCQPLLDERGLGGRGCYITGLMDTAVNGMEPECVMQGCGVPPAHAGACHWIRMARQKAPHLLGLCTPTPPHQAFFVVCLPLPWYLCPERPIKAGCRGDASLRPHSCWPWNQSLSVPGRAEGLSRSGPSQVR